MFRVQRLDISKNEGRSIRPPCAYFGLRRWTQTTISQSFLAKYLAQFIDQYVPSKFDGSRWTPFQDEEWYSFAVDEPEWLIILEVSSQRMYDLKSKRWSRKNSETQTHQLLETECCNNIEHHWSCFELIMLIV